LLVAFFPSLPAFAVDTADRELLILVYQSGTNDRGLNDYSRDVINQLEKVGRSDKTTILVKYAMMEKGKEKDLLFPENTRTLLIKDDKGDPEITSPVIKSSPVSDMASETSLFMFVRKSILKYPAKRVLVVLWGKGEGFRSALDDDLSGNRLTLPAMARVLSKARKDTKRKIDVLVLDRLLRVLTQSDIIVPGDMTPVRTGRSVKKDGQERREQKEYRLRRFADSHRPYLFITFIRFICEQSTFPPVPPFCP
jgi:hypothetical protein